MGEKKGSIWLYLFIIGYPLFVYYNTINLLALSSEVLEDLLKIPHEKYDIFFILLCSAVYPFNMIYVIRRTFKYENLEFLKDSRFVWIIPCFILAMLFFGEWAWVLGWILTYPLFILAETRFGIGFISAIVLLIPQVINAVITVKEYRQEIKKMFVFLYILTVITILIGYGRLVRVMAELFTGAWWW